MRGIWIFKSVVFKWFISIIVVFAFVLFPLYVSITKLVTSFYDDKATNDLLHFAKNYAQIIEESNSVNGVRSIVQLADFIGHGVIIVDEAGSVIFNNNLPIYSEGTKLSIEEMKEYLNGYAYSRKVRTTINQISYVYVGVPIHIQSKFSGSILVFQTTDKIDQIIIQVKRNIALASIGALFLAIGLSIALSARISQPLLSMERIARKMASGDYSEKMKVRGNDEIYKLSDAINKLAENLHYHRSSRQQFLSEVSHELRTPLTYIQGYTDVLQKRLYKGEAEQESYLTIIREETERLKSIVDDLLTLAQLDQGKLVLTMEEISLNELLESAIRKISVKAGQKLIKINIDLEDGVFISGDGNRLMQVMLIVLENSIRYTSEGGNLDISLQKEPHFAVIQVHDTGMGISPEELPFIWEAFYRTEKSRSRDYGGSGLGLSIAKQIIFHHHGTIQAKNGNEMGTIFTIQLPYMEGIK